MLPYDEDTNPEMRRALLDRVRAMTPAERLARMVALNRSVEAMARTGIRMRHPEATEREVRLLLARAWLEPETLAKIAAKVPVP